MQKIGSKSLRLRCVLAAGALAMANVASAGTLNGGVFQISYDNPDDLLSGLTLGDGAITSYYVANYFDKSLADNMNVSQMLGVANDTYPAPATLSFDINPRDVCEVRRARTSTPLQALVMLNDEQILEAARVLAAQVLQEGRDHGSKTEEEIATAFRRVLTRKPERAEIQQLVSLYREELARFQKKPAQAKKLLQTGRYPQNTALDPAEQSAMMLVVSTIFNLDEAVSKT